MLISLLIPKNMQNFSQFYRLISKIVFFSTQKLQVRFPTGGAATGSLPGRPERLKNVPDHLALEAKVKIGPLSRCIFASSMLSLMIFLLEYWHPTDKQHSTCRRTASTSPRFVPAECDDTWSVVYQSGSKWFAWAIGERPPGYRNGVKISILTFLFWKSSPFPLPCGRMGTASLWGASFLLF